MQRMKLEGVNGDGSADELNAFRRKVCCTIQAMVSQADHDAVLSRLRMRSLREIAKLCRPQSDLYSPARYSDFMSPDSIGTVVWGRVWK